MTYVDIISIGLTYRNKNISNVFVAYSSKINMILMQRLNRALHDECQGSGFTFIDNGAVWKNDLWVGRIYLKESSKGIIANNLINNFSQFLESMNPLRCYLWRESFLLPESESAWQNTSDKDHGSYSLRERWEINLKRSPLAQLLKIQIGNANKVTIGNLNINSIRNKFEQLKDIVLKYIDNRVVTEIKFDETFFWISVFDGWFF